MNRNIMRALAMDSQQKRATVRLRN